MSHDSIYYLVSGSKKWIITLIKFHCSNLLIHTSPDEKAILGQKLTTLAGPEFDKNRTPIVVHSYIVD